VTKEEEKNWKRVGCVRNVRWCTEQCSVTQASRRWTTALGKQRSDAAINHRTVQWCTGLFGGAPDCPVSRQRRTRRSREKKKAMWLWFTGLSGESTAPAANGRPRDQRATRGSHQRSVRHIRQCPMRQLTRRTNDRLCPVWKEIEHRTATVVVRWRTGLSGAPLDRRQELPSKLVSNGS
jgi:hypothetical protein